MPKIKKVSPDQFVNLCPHDVVILDTFGNELFVIPPSKTLAQVKREFTETVFTFEVEGTGVRFDVDRVIYGPAEGLPDEDFHHYYIVSRIVKNGYPNRDDVLVVGQLISKYGKKIGCLGLCL